MNALLFVVLENSLNVEMNFEFCKNITKAGLLCQCNQVEPRYIS